MSKQDVGAEREREETTGGWRKLYDEVVYNSYSSPDIITVIKWGGGERENGRGDEERRNVYRVSGVKGRDHLGGLGGDGFVWDLLKQNLNDNCGD